MSFVSNARSLGTLVSLSLGFAALAHAETSGQNGSHDPSRMIQSDGKLYISSTGGGLKSSTDGLAWKDEAGLPWNRSLAGNQGVWAPDGLFYQGKYWMFGSLWNEGDKSSRIVLLTSPTLDPGKASWKDGGTVVDGPKGVTHSCIDAAPVIDQEGNFWMVFGGGYPFKDEANSIILTRLDNQTGLALQTDPGYQGTALPGYALKQGHKEGPYIHFHDGYYYLFWQTGSCCSGASSGYTIHMARSQKITGPYPDDKIFYSSKRPAINGPGHMGIYDSCGYSRFTYHYYPASGGSVIGHNELVWGADGWPSVGADAGAIKPCNDPYGAGGGVGGSGGGGGAGGAAGSAGMAGAGGAVGGAGGASGGEPPVTMAGSGGVPGTGGVTSTAGAPMTSGGVSGGSLAMAGGSSTAGASDDEEADSSCSVSNAGERSSRLGWLAVSLALVLSARRRRRAPVGG